MKIKRFGTRRRGAPRAEEFLRAFAREYLSCDPAALLFRVLRASACISFLAGCTTAGSPPSPQCIPLTVWTSAQQDEMRKEYDALPKDAILRAVFMDWVGMRDADRACMSAGEK